MPSCQNYRDGVVNEALLGYTDPNSKLIIIKNDKGSLIGRAVFRVLSDSEGKPALHLETIYSHDMSEGVIRSVYKHAIKKARIMGVPVYISRKSQNQFGEMKGNSAVRQISFQSAGSIKLHSSSSRAPYVYVDSAGGSMPNGVYEIGDLHMLLDEENNIAVNE